jgi:hypothetical protein
MNKPLGDLRWHDIHTKFYDDQFRYSSTVKVITSTIQRLQYWYY